MDNSALYRNLLKLLGGSTAVGAVALSGAYLIAPSEGLVLGTYLDPVGIVTSCYGHVDKQLKLGQKFTQEQCDKQFAQDLIKHDTELSKVVKVPYRTVYEHAALLSFTYNVGIGNVKTSTLLKKLNAGYHEDACAELNKWVFASQKGILVKLKGLVVRRTKEQEWCLGITPLEVKYNIDNKQTTGVVK